MAFNLDRYLQTPRLPPRTAELRFAELAPFCEPGDEPVFIVRALTGHEIARANEASDRLERTRAAVEAMVSAGTVRADAFGDLLLSGDAVPEDLAKRIEHAMLGTVAPVLDREAVLRLLAEYPMVIWALTRKIWELTGLGADAGKALGSGAIPASEPVSP